MTPPFRPAIASLLLIATGVGATGRAGEESAAGESTKFVLFMGTDLSVQQGKKFYRVEDVDGSEFVITVGGKSRFVRTRLQANQMKVERELKLAPVSVQLDDLQGGPGYTPANDPRHKFNARSGAAAGASAAATLADYNVTEATATLEAVKAAPVPWKEREAQLETEISRQQGQLDVATQNLTTDFSSTGAAANALSLELAEGNYDLVDVSFKVSSPEVLDDPYMVVLVEFEPRGAKPGETSTLIHAKALDPIGPTPKYIRVREGGMPVGFKYLRHEVHIFNRGKEVATSESSKRVELNPVEARQYLLLEHLAANKGATLPPQAVPGSLPVAWRQRVKGDQLDRVCYARVAKDGSVLGIFADEGASLALADDDIVAALRAALFRPALSRGQPAEGIARVRLADVLL